MCRSRWAFVALLLWVGSGLADSKKTKDPPNSNEVEIRLTDGSRVRMLILEETLNVATKYGKLSVPTSDLHRIELGIHPPAAVAQKIEEAIKRLGDKSFQEREKATTDLVMVGAAAYLALHKAAKTKDPEVAQRTKQVLEQIRQKVPEAKLRLREDDRIQTTEFTIVGRVLNTTLKVKSAIFGETQLNMADLRGIHWLGQLAEVDLEIEAAKYAVNPAQWMDTGLELILDDELVIRASGQVDLMANNPGQFLSGPDGSQQFGQGPGMYLAGALLGRIGENGQVFVIGASHQAPCKTEGKLYLQIAAGPWPRGGGHTASGSYKVVIAGGRRSQAR